MRVATITEEEFQELVALADAPAEYISQFIDVKYLDMFGFIADLGTIYIDKIYAIKELEDKTVNENKISE